VGQFEIYGFLGNLEWPRHNGVSQNIKIFVAFHALDCPILDSAGAYGDASCNDLLLLTVGARYSLLCGLLVLRQIHLDMMPLFHHEVNKVLAFRIPHGGYNVSRLRNGRRMLTGEFIYSQ
jgi:hypothetical protein